jgi:predicted  nucleic acid-binding Zn-ribbon protein
MPHKCTECGLVYEKGSPEILEGCSCGNRKFFFFRPLTEEEAEKLKEEENAKEIKANAPRTDDDIWNIKIEEGVYDLDLAALMSKKPVIVAGEEGRYLLSLSSALKDAGKGKTVKYTKRKKKD